MLLRKTAGCIVSVMKNRDFSPQKSDKGGKMSTNYTKYTNKEKDPREKTANTKDVDFFG